MWRKDLDVTPISGIQSDRLCAIRIKMCDTNMTVIGVYMPCAGTDIQAYGSHLIELERLVTEAQSTGLVCVMGDFNAHIGVQDGFNDSMNPEGVLIEQWIDRCSLYATSLTPSRSGPTYTYFKSDKQTTVDYVFIDIKAAEYITYCHTHDYHNLNSSDHLPISCEFSIPFLLHPSIGKDMSFPKVNWSNVMARGDYIVYQQHISQTLANIADASYDNIQEVNRDILSISKSLQEAASSTLPLQRPAKVRKRWYADERLSRLCRQKKEAWDNWKKAGSPKDGALYEIKNVLREEVRKRLKICKAN